MNTFSNNIIIELLALETVSVTDALSMWISKKQ